MKKGMVFCCAVLLAFCYLMPAEAITKQQEGAIIDHCESIRESLKNVQKNDARARVHLGGEYETILSKFIMPLNVKLVEDNLSNAELVENQNSFAETKVKFSNDYIEYQQGLEELVLMDCKEDPEGFYEKLGEVRQQRKVVAKDVAKMKDLIERHLKLVVDLRGELK